MVAWVAHPDLQSDRFLSADCLAAHLACICGVAGAVCGCRVACHMQPLGAWLPLRARWSTDVMVTGAEWLPVPAGAPRRTSPRSAARCWRSGA